MSNTFKNEITAAIGLTETTVYTSPASTVSTIIGLSVANATIATNSLISVKMFDDSTATDVYLIRNAPLPVGGSLIIIGGDQKIVLESADYITVISSEAASVDVALSVLQIT